MGREVAPGRYATTLTWDDAPHLSPAERARRLRAIPRHMRGPRVRGEPAVEAGRIYQFDFFDDLSVPNIYPIPDVWPRVYGMDFGGRKSQTAGLWAAWDRDADVLYFYSEYYQSKANIQMHAQAFINHGARWIPGVADPSSLSGQMRDGEALIDSYISYGLNLEPAKNPVEAGIERVIDRMATGRLKFFKTLYHIRFELQMYHRDEEGRIPRGQPNHLLDCMRYVILSGLPRARTRSSAMRHISEHNATVVDERAGY